jgi:hypothetical protein
MSTQITRRIYKAVVKSRTLVEKLISFAATLHISRLYAEVEEQGKIVDNAVLHADYLEAAARNADKQLGFEISKERSMTEQLHLEVASILGR